MTEIIAAAVFVLWNIITFAMYGADKGKARGGRWRISETALIACAFLMGGLGSFLGMRAFRHKTRHLKFKLLIPLAIAVNIGIVALLFHTGILGTVGL